jgi:peptide/nickel transport system permease protein/oligopeptide transport system permease protein
MGLDEPVWVQFAIYLGRVLQFDLGRSMISNRPVIEELGGTIGPTLELMAASLAWAIPAGLTLGTLAAVNRGHILDRAIVALSVAGVSMPVFWFGLLLIQYVGTALDLLPFQGRGGPLWSLDGLRHVALPAITLGGVFVGPVARMTRTSLLEVLGADFVRTARAKGASRPRVVIRHALRNALIPVVTLIGLQIGFLLGGAVVTETMFAWPGVGRMAVGAITSSDFPLAQGAILMLAVGFIAINLWVDVIYAYLDPRIGRA